MFASSVEYLASRKKWLGLTWHMYWNIEGSEVVLWNKKYKWKVRGRAIRLILLTRTFMWFWWFWYHKSLYIYLGRISLGEEKEPRKMIMKNQASEHRGQFRQSLGMVLSRRHHQPFCLLFLFIKGEPCLDWMASTGGLGGFCSGVDDDR